MEKTIKVKGSAVVNAKPDFVNILIDCETKRWDYDECVGKAAVCVENLKAALAKVNADPSGLKTTRFDISSDNEWISDGEGRSRRKFVGYSLKQSLKFGLDFAKERLMEVLGSLAHSGVNPAIRLEFTVKERYAVKEELFAKACANARTIAERLCRGSGVTLGEIVSIDYSWTDVDIHCDYAIPSAMYDSDAGVVPDIDPEDITAADSVTFVWTVK